jgi:hypothetical protein
MNDEKLSGRLIIDTILVNMSQQVEELRYSKVVPAAFDVYLHADDQQRFELLAHEIAAEAVRALQEKLDALNRPSRLDRARDLVGRSRLPFKKVGPWLVRITRDPEGAVPRGRALVVSQIALAGADSFEGQRTRRLATLSEPASPSSETREAAPEVLPRSGSASRAPEPVVSEQPSRSEPLSPAALAERGVAQHADTRETLHSPALAVLAWEDERGSHRFAMTALELTVGRSGEGSTADVRLATVPDVSRLHLRLRYHSEERRFSIEDLSQFGTAVEGVPLERGAPRDLYPPADIRLAGAITLRVERGTLA